MSAGKTTSGGTAMKLREFVEEQERLDPEFAEARHEFQPEAALMRAMIEARQSQISRKRNWPSAAV